MNEKEFLKALRDLNNYLKYDIPFHLIIVVLKFLFLLLIFVILSFLPASSPPPSRQYRCAHKHITNAGREGWDIPADVPILLFLFYLILKSEFKRKQSVTQELVHLTLWYGTLLLSSASYSTILGRSHAASIWVGGELLIIFCLPLWSLGILRRLIREMDAMGDKGWAPGSEVDFLKKLFLFSGDFVHWLALCIRLRMTNWDPLPSSLTTATATTTQQTHTHKAHAYNNNMRNAACSNKIP